MINQPRVNCWLQLLLGLVFASSSVIVFSANQIPEEIGRVTEIARMATSRIKLDITMTGMEDSDFNLQVRRTIDIIAAVTDNESLIAVEDYFYLAKYLVAASFNEKETALHALKKTMRSSQFEPMSQWIRRRIAKNNFSDFCIDKETESLKKIFLR